MNPHKPLIDYNHETGDLFISCTDCDFKGQFVTIKNSRWVYDDPILNEASKILKEDWNDHHFKKEMPF